MFLGGGSSGPDSLGAHPVERVANVVALECAAPALRSNKAMRRVKDLKRIFPKSV
jgi:hypothetical protein